MHGCPLDLLCFTLRCVYLYYLLPAGEEDRKFQISGSYRVSVEVYVRCCGDSTSFSSYTSLPYNSALDLLSVFCLFIHIFMNRLHSADLLQNDRLPVPSFLGPVLNRLFLGSDFQDLHCHHQFHREQNKKLNRLALRLLHPQSCLFKCRSAGPLKCHGRETHT